MKEFPYFNKKLRVIEKDKIKQREAIFDKILKQMDPENDKYYVKYNRHLDIYYIGKDEKVIVNREVNREGNEKENQQVTWMRLIKSRKNKLKQKA